MEETDSGDRSDDRTIFVGNLPYRMTWKQMTKYFSKFGNVTYARAMTDYVTKKPKGYGFVEFKTCEAADRAASALDDELQCYGRTLRVSLKESKGPERKPRGKKSSDKKADKVVVEEDEAVEEFDPSSLISRLNDDSLILILSYLTPIEKIAVERVCRRWRRCARTAAKLQRHMTLVKQFKSFGAFSENIFYKIMQRTGCNLKSLNVSLVSSRFGNTALQIIAQCCENIEKLDLSGVDASNKGMDKFTSQCQNIKWLKVVGCLTLAEKGFWYIFHNCKKLEYLNCSGNPGITGKCLKHAEATLKHLHLNNCKNLRNDGILTIVQRCPNLETLKLNSCEHLTYDTLSQLIKSSPALTDLSIGNLSCQSKTQVKLFRHIVEYCVNPKKLVKLELFNSGLNDSNLQWICANCLSLTELDISCNRLTDASVAQISSLKHLQFLSACHLYSITHESLMEVVSQGKLRILRIQGCKRLTDKLMQVVADNCKQIEEVDMAGVPSITAATLRKFSQVAQQRTGKPVYLYVAYNSFTDDTVAKFARQQGVIIIENYRPLYPFKLRWEVDSEEEALRLRTQNLELEDAKLHNPMYPTLDPGQGGWILQRVVGLPADMMDSDEEFGDEYEYEDAVGDEFLVNDDPLAMEHFEDFMS